MSNQKVNRRMILTFNHDGMRYGVFARYVLEIIALPPLSPMPGRNQALRGIFAYKGKIVPVLSFRGLCGRAPQKDAQDGEAEQTCLILCQDDTDLTIGLSIAKAEDLITEDMEWIPYEREEAQRGIIRIDRILKGGGEVAVLDLSATLGNLGVKWGREL